MKKLLFIFSLISTLAFGQSHTFPLHDSTSIDSAVRGLKTVRFNTYVHLINGQVVELRGVDFNTYYKVLKASLGSVVAESGTYLNAGKIRLGGTLLENAVVYGSSTNYSMTFDSMSGFFVRNNFNSPIQFQFRTSKNNLINDWTVTNTTTGIKTFLKMNTTLPQLGILNTSNNLDAYIRFSNVVDNLIEIINNGFGALNISSNGTEQFSYFKSLDAAPRLYAYNIQNDSLNLGVKFGTALPAPTHPILPGYVKTLIDPLTGEWTWQAPTGGGGGSGDNWGTQVVERSGEFAGNGTLSTPLKLAQQGATTGQSLRWNGSAFTPSADPVYNWYANDGTLISNRMASGAGFDAVWRNMKTIKFDSNETFIIQTKYNPFTGVTASFTQDMLGGGGLLRANNPQGSGTQGSRTNDIYYGSDGVAMYSAPSGTTPIPNSTNRFEANSISAKLKTGRLEMDNSLKYSDSPGATKIRQGCIPMAYKYSTNAGTTKDNTDGDLVYSAMRYPINAAPADGYVMISKSDSFQLVQAATLDYTRKATINAVGFSEGLPVTAGLAFETFFIVSSEMNGWTLNGWELTLGEQSHTAGTLSFDLVRVPAGGASGVGVALAKNINLVANNRYGIYGSSFSQTVNTGDIIQIKYVSNTGVVGSPKGLCAKLNFIK